jgi:hypothetical protein
MEIDSYLSQKHRKRKKRRGYIYGTAFVLFLYAIFWGVAWLVLRSPVFRVDAVVVAGNQDVSTDTVTAILDASVIRSGDAVKNGQSGVKALLGLENMLVWPSAIPTSDLALAPQLSNITISKDYFSHTVTANVTERTPFAIWCLMNGDQSCYWFDDQGIVFQRTFATQGSALLSVNDYSQTHLGLGATVLPDDFTPNLISILNVLKTSGVNVNQIALNDLSLQEIDVTTYNGPALYFSLRFPADDDLPVLQNLMTTTKFSKLQYVDFRVDNRVYYK